MENVYTWKNLKHDRTQGIGAIEHGQTTLSLERIYQERPLTMVTKWNESFKVKYHSMEYNFVRKFSFKPILLW